MSFWERQNLRLFYICYFCTYSCTIEPLVSDHFFKIPKKFPSQITINETSRKRLLFVSDPTFREWPLRLDISGGCLREIWLYYYRSSLLFAICYFFTSLNWPEKYTVGCKCNSPSSCSPALHENHLLITLATWVSGKTAEMALVNC